MQSVWTFLSECMQQDMAVVLMVIVESTEGTPGKPGFKMGVAGDGRLHGTIGGGKMEHDLVEDARAMLAAGATEPVSRRRTHSEDAPRDRSGMICGGTQVVLLYPCTARDRDVMQRLATAEKSQEPGLLRMTPDSIEYVDASEDGGGGPSCTAFKMAGEREWIYEEALGLKDTVYIAGGGHVCLALSRILSTLRFRIVVFDDRADVSTLQENTYAHGKRVIPFDEMHEHVVPGDSSYVVIITPSHRHDEVVLRQFIDKPLRYLGLMGTKRKLKRIFDHMRADGYHGDMLDRVRAPIGIPIGSHTAEEVAVSIAAELITVRNRPPSGPDA
ncbi:MAG: XdhC family protein [Kiritimatiellia bacterium]|nr:XdhC family protein [Kiritimatiellia bacterium]MDP6631753.1 XdhC family protein [Kiritimatiellia bacterium]MDP6810493.1 XdhC family protein [Kiritimatiellia bacterium]MDP7024989.1 XdhC family protein [Kiritimatiellia bacterium]